METAPAKVKENSRPDSAPYQDLRTVKSAGIGTDNQRVAVKYDCKML
ncbi:hypothetical protein O4H49_04175 [Kiloniella laminariae]|uniref:Uncharacterized protein n=1 Tax=Kiloniella laminariae TaxID=454162 RepID=A0ABT4LFU1_9PROT|nr:hypothetical protein [Kiloniella laminariae]MCZ4279962.1 hypothetical protein [Kiloniella laminariae]